MTGKLRSAWLGSARLVIGMFNAVTNGLTSSMPAAGVDARFPFRARLAGVGDSVTVAFTVDAAGSIAPESLELVRATYGVFVSSVLNALAKTHFHPAYLGDCPVATRMTQRFVFKVPE